MIRSERMAKMRDLIISRKFASIEEIAASLSVSKATVRRDLSILSQDKQIMLVRGGAMTEDGKHTNELAYEEKRTWNIAEKDRIGKAASKFVKPGDVVLIDAGTTTRAILPYIKNIPGLHIVTNDIMIAADLANCSDIEITLTGGQLRKGFYTVRGYVAESLIKDIRADICFIGIDAISFESGCMITNTDEITLKRNMINASDRVVVLSDHSKFNITGFITVCNFTGIHTIVTGKELSTEIFDRFSKKNINLLRV